MALDLRLCRDEQRRVDASFVKSYLTAIGTELSNRICGLYFSGAHKELVEIPMPDPHAYTDAHSFRNDYLAWNFLRKNRSLKTGISTKDVAIAKMEISESVCADTNRRWRNLMSFDYKALHFISKVQSKIYDILGPDIGLDEFISCSSWGPGSTLDIKSREASSFRKYRDERGITADALNFILNFFDEKLPKLAGRIFTIYPGDKVITVHKDATTDRVIKVQPGWNVYFQKGLGQIIRRRLRRYGLDLNLTAPVDNQRISFYGSVDGYWSTTDLRSASDRLAIEPLRQVLPDVWFSALDVFRCKSSLSGRRWNGFSAMGNGFTFELETLLFYAISIVVCEDNGYDKSFVSVFGDDIISPSSVQKSLQEALSLFGFEINPSKTFSSGAFRESCGEHYYDGLSCKPYYHKDKIRTIEDIYKAYNGTIRVADRGDYRDSRFLSTVRTLRRHCPVNLRNFVPKDYGDIGFHGSFQEACPSVYRKDGILYYAFRGILSKPVRWTTDEPELLLVRLTEMSDLPRHNYVEVKQRVYKSVKRYKRTSDWPDLGPWL